MSSALRTTFAIGIVFGAMSGAQAGGRSASETFPTLATLPSGRPAAPAAAAPAETSAAVTPKSAAAPTKPESRGKGRRTRFARTSLPVAPGGPSVAPTGGPPVVPGSAPPRAAMAEAGAPPRAAEAGSPTPAVEARPEPAPSREAAAPTPAEARLELGRAVEAAAPTLAALIAKHATAAGVPVGLAQAVVRIESRGNARAAHAGALGLMQIKAATARAAGFVGTTSGLLDADTNLHFGMKVLADAYKGSGGDVCRALMKYQSGHLATRMTRANRTYCSRARAIMAGA